MGVSSRPIAVPSSLPWIFVSRDSIGKEERRGTVVIEICDREFDGKRIKISILKELFKKLSSNIKSFVTGAKLKERKRVMVINP